MDGYAFGLGRGDHYREDDSPGRDEDRCPAALCETCAVEIWSRDDIAHVQDQGFTSLDVCPACAREAVGVISPVGGWPEEMAVA